MKNKIRILLNLILHISTIIFAILIYFSKLEQIFLLSSISFLIGIYIIIISIAEYRLGEEIFILRPGLRFLFFKKIYIKNKNEPGFKQELLVHFIAGFIMIGITLFLIYYYYYILPNIS